MNLGLKDQFVPFVEDGSKTHTIRGGFRWKVGMRADLFARPRQKGMRLIFRAIVVRVELIEIYPPPLKFRCPLCGTRELHDHLDYFEIFIESQALGSDERDAFAWRDGFRPWPKEPSDTTPYSTLNTMAFRHMMEFWARTHNIEQLCGPFVGQLIHWDYEGRFVEKPTKVKQPLDTAERLVRALDVARALTGGLGR